jgi:uncharacterized membrane-anchored protein
MRVLALVLGFFAVVVCGSMVNAEVPKTDAARKAAIQALTWREGELLELPSSRGTLKTPKGFDQLLGQNAVSLYEILNGVEAPRGTEAAIYDKKSTAIVFFQNISGGGFVRLDDWDQVDADAMLKSVSEKTEAANAKRKEVGISPIHVEKWLERPHLNRATNTVRWAFELTEDGSEPLVNSVALVLGRDGFEKLVWAGPKSALNDGLLNIALESFSFPVGGRYADYKDGDKVAEYGIAGLVASVLGAKFAAKVGLFAALAVLLKKFGVFIVIGAGAVVVWLWRVIGRKKQT